MPSPTFPTLPSGLDFRVFPIPQGHNPGTMATEMESGHQARRLRWDQTLREFSLHGENMPWLDIETVMAWGRDTLVNWSLYFYYAVESPLYRPYTAPTLSQTAGGALAQRTYYVTYTWGDGTNETTESQESSLTVDANKYLVVTLPANFPTNVDRAKIYIGTSTGAEKYEDVIVTNKGSWTQSGALSGAVDPPSSNTWMEQVCVFLKAGTILAPQKDGPQTWVLDIPVVEHKLT